VVAVGHVVGDERAEHADHDDDGPVDRRHVALEPELGEQERGEKCAGHVGRVRQAEAEIDVQVSAAVSPTVVHMILMTQNQRVTSGTLFSIVRPNEGDLVAVAVVFMAAQGGVRSMTPT
jgi:hypothetical protein